MLIFSHADCLDHRMQAEHPECPERLQAVTAALRRAPFGDALAWRDAPAVSARALARTHHPDYLAALADSLPRQGLVPLDGDTALCPSSGRAAARAAGAVEAAVRAVLQGEDERAFCAVRPPGHHAEYAAGMGFCLYNNVAVGALAALEDHGLERVAILDFDVHHGNGTVDIFQDDPRVLVCSTFQHPHYPNRHWNTRRAHLIHSPLPAGAGSREFRSAVERDWLPALAAHRPQLLLVSAGFDAHRMDPLAQLEFTEADFAWATQQLLTAAAASACGRVVSSLEGGYDLAALAASAVAHVAALGQFPG